MGNFFTVEGYNDILDATSVYKQLASVFDLLLNMKILFKGKKYMANILFTEILKISYSRKFF